MDLGYCSPIMGGSSLPAEYISVTQYEVESSGVPEEPRSRIRLQATFVRVGILVLLVSLFAQGAQAAPAADKGFSGIELRIGGGTSKDGLTVPMQILVLMTLLSLIPAFVMSVTCFTRIIVVSHFLRQALGTQTMPPNQVLIGLSLFLTYFIMQPVGDRIYQEALQPMFQGKITEMQALDQACNPLRQFMLRYTREKDLALFLNIAKVQKPRNLQDLPMRIVVPSFMISELKTAFQIGFILFIPFLVIDMVVAAVLLSMGMMQLPPVVISTPFKILLFVMVDGWNLVIGSLVKSFY
ncbi:MAG TPA: flagellar type III secretion system pore protein FliP [Acidobacteriota bacterium]|nr:flagellar type III secretion system pore protein FliP [Acidobacteriota bacterium]